MAKVTSKLQFTIPKALADSYGIRAGDEIDLEADGPVIRLVPPRARRRHLTTDERLALFDEATERQRERERKQPVELRPSDRSRGWTREELYHPPRGMPRTDR